MFLQARVILQNLFLQIFFYKTMFLKSFILQSVFQVVKVISIVIGSVGMGGVKFVTQSDD